MRSSNLITIFALVATAMATLSRPDRSVARCSDWSGTCAPGSTYNRVSDALKCETDKDSDAACLIKCCVEIEKIPSIKAQATTPPKAQVATPPKVQADPLPRKARSVARCSDWSGTCAPGSTYNTASDALKCQTDKDSDAACLIKCCVEIETTPPPKAQATTPPKAQATTPPKAQNATPPRSRRSVAKCSKWTGQCAPGNTFNTASNVVECETSEDSDVSCLIKCCLKVEANTSNSVISCKEKNELDAGYKCSANEQLIDDRSCCRWAGECDTLLQCKQGTCCDPKEG
ncbi:hypothetical protein SARC_10548 [Sphaeroforma arctica JP610]|uniref:WAP domain-containing protein n=1 Tax=Sphaeroforma arctica JP610 TaxID=667725 RepID=A0A0L0FLT4_9EUKA|nr:hypothetical protein SARC_10548 [Sphaeroforma arctica JP610]KNC76978.1 hypothetical protein SARC_10548 [Sphaeroforma arctica JP610]|eukprot:XP_014150880.1 hypothetical protein SARC_10548 [Sphaeroforma arctica JP610]